MFLLSKESEIALISTMNEKARQHICDYITCWLKFVSCNHMGNKNSPNRMGMNLRSWINNPLWLQVWDKPFQYILSLQIWGNITSSKTKITDLGTEWLFFWWSCHNNRKRNEQTLAKETTCRARSNLIFIHHLYATSSTRNPKACIQM